MITETFSITDTHTCLLHAVTNTYEGETLKMRLRKYGSCYFVLLIEHQSGSVAIPIFIWKRAIKCVHNGKFQQAQCRQKKFKMHMSLINSFINKLGFSSVAMAVTHRI